MNNHKLEKLDNFTVVSNSWMRDKTLSLKTRGLLCTLQSLPQGWEFSVKGLQQILPDGEFAIRNSIKEASDRGYLEWKQTHNKDGSFGTTTVSLSQGETQLGNPVSGKPRYGETKDNKIYNIIKETNIKGTSNLKKKQEKVDYEEVFNDNNINGNLKSALLEFIEYRKQLKKPVTKLALKKLINKTKTIASNEREQIECINRSIENGWTGIFPLKGENNFGNNKAPETVDLKNGWRIIEIDGKYKPINDKYPKQYYISNGDYWMMYGENGNLEVKIVKDERGKPIKLTFKKG